ncbi:uncharacterized protein DEA37_0006651 [Paragonimus westermani]|uniref:Uncharacterized protein n=1 Tax=Paragonimus westermani TaxID=34504 RepID=A0A5J4NQR1_9TREM|nr:uncharacterized protein DEA37_0006651 [Paragonimus westermani]
MHPSRRYEYRKQGRLPNQTLCLLVTVLLWYWTSI